MKIWRHVMTATLAWGFAASAALGQALPGPVVDTAWLAANLDKVQVLDLRGSAKSFTADPEMAEAKGKKVVEEVGGHIAGSRLMEFKTIRVEREINGSPFVRDQ